MKNYTVNTPAGPAVAQRTEGWMKRALRKGSALLGVGLLAATALPVQGPALNLGERGRLNLPKASHSDVGRPQVRAHNPLLAGVAYIYRQDQWSPYFVATGGALNQQTLFTVIPGQQYTPSGGAAQTITIWHTTMRQGGLLNNPDMFNVLYMSLSVRGDTMVTDLNRFLSDSMITLFIGNDTPYGQTHAYRVPAAGGGYGASSGIVSNGFPQIANQYEMETTQVNGVSTASGGTGEIFPGSALAGNLGELVTQQQRLQVSVEPTKVVDANGNATYTTNAGGTGITAFVVLRGQYSRAVQG